MNHDELIEYGCASARMEDHQCETKSGYWLDGVYLGSSPEDATLSLLG